MGRFTKQLVVGLAVALALAGGAFASGVLDDFEKGTNENKFGAYWYFYTNTYAKAPANQGGPCDKTDFSQFLEESNMEQITNATKEGKALLFNGKYNSQAAHGGKYSGIMEFKNLRKEWKGSTGKTEKTGNDVYPGVGMGTGLTTDTLNGMGADFKPSACKFWIKVSDPGVISTVKFKIEFATQVAGNGNKWDCNADASYEYTMSSELSTSWQEVTVPLDTKAMKRPDWEKDKPYTFDLSKALKVAWFMEGQTIGTEEGISGWIAVDDVEFVGYDFKDKWVCEDCQKPATTAPEGEIFSTFDNRFTANGGYAQNALGQYWYAYNDESGRKDAGATGSASTIDAGTTNDEYYQDGPSLDMTADNVFGYKDTKGAFIQFTMGEEFKDKQGNTVLPFVGLGSNLADVDNNGPLYNGTGLTHIWFRYKTSGFEELYVEVSDEYNLSHDDYEVFYTKLPGTTEWKVAKVPLSALKLPSWAKNRPGSANKDLNKAKLAKIQFKNQSAADGTLQIDDVYFVGSNLGLNDVGVGVKLAGSKVNGVNGLRATYRRGNVGVSWNAAQSVTEGKVQLVNTKGRVVASVPITAASGKVTADLSASTIPTGMYFVRVNAKDVNGKKIVQQAPISIVK